MILAEEEGRRPRRDVVVLVVQRQPLPVKPPSHYGRELAAIGRKAK